MRRYISILRIHAVTLISIGFLLVASACFERASAATDVVGSLEGWHATLVGIVLFSLMATYALRMSSYAALVPRFWLLTTFLVWILTVSMQGNVTDAATAYYGSLLQAPVLMTLALLIARRIQTVFAPAISITWWLWLVLTLITAPTYILAATTLNYSLLLTKDGFVLYSEFIAVYTPIAAGSIVLLAVWAIYLGRRAVKPQAYLDVPNLTFTKPAHGRDMNLISTAEDVVEVVRKAALKHGRWISWRRAVFMRKGIIVSDPQAVHELITKLCVHAIAHTSERTITVRVVASTNGKVVHCVISHPKYAKATLQWPDRSIPTTAASLGGVATMQQTSQAMRYIISWPLEL